MIEQIVNWTIGILMVLALPYVVYFNAIHFSARWKCRKKGYAKPFNACHESDCKYAGYCQEYEHVFTAEEIAKLEKLVEKLKD